jgi:hypothetical protein
MNPNKTCIPAEIHSCVRVVPRGSNPCGSHNGLLRGVTNTHIYAQTVGAKSMRASYAHVRTKCNRQRNSSWFHSLTHKHAYMLTLTAAANSRSGNGADAKVASISNNPLPYVYAYLGASSPYVYVHIYVWICMIPSLGRCVYA